MICEKCGDYFDRSKEKVSQAKKSASRCKLCPKCWQENRTRRKVR